MLNVDMQKCVKQFQTIIKQSICIHLYIIWHALISEIKSRETDAVVSCAELQSIHNSRFLSAVHQTHQQLKGQFLL